MTGRFRSFAIAVAALGVVLPTACGGGDAEPVAAPSKSTADVIREIEEQRLHALVVRDIAKARALHADDFTLTTPRGDTLSKNAYLEAVESGRLDYVVFEPISPIRVTVTGAKATLRYRSKIGFAGNFGGTTEQSHVDTYELRDGRWQIVRSMTS
jgi:hypothetical protein